MIGVDIPVFNELHGKIALRDESGNCAHGYTAAVLERSD